MDKNVIVVSTKQGHKFISVQNFSQKNVLDALVSLFKIDINDIQQQGLNLYSIKKQISVDGYLKVIDVLDKQYFVKTSDENQVANFEVIYAISL